VVEELCYSVELVTVEKNIFDKIICHTSDSDLIPKPKRKKNKIQQKKRRRRKKNHESIKPAKYIYIGLEPPNICLASI